MKRWQLPGTQLSIFPLILGTDYYGKTVPEDSAYLLMDTFCEQGGNLLDTAHVYSDYLPGEKHMSEKVIGRWLRKSGMDKALGSSFYIATKGGFPKVGDMHASRISFQEIQGDLEESLECLSIGSIDLYWLHRDNPAVPVEEITEWMNVFLRQGKIKSYGYSNWTSERIAASLKYAERRGLAAPAASQIRWSLAVTSEGVADDDTLVEMTPKEYAWYAQQRFPVFAFSSQAKGFFSKLRREDGKYLLPDGKAGARYSNPVNLSTYEKLLKISAKYGITIAQAALAWILYAPFPAFPIIGCKTAEQLRESMKAAEYSDVEEFSQQSKIFQH